VRAGLKGPWDVMPYGTWTLTERNGSRLGGVAYDAATKKTFVSQIVGEGRRPLIHVYTVRQAARRNEWPPLQTSQRWRDPQMLPDGHTALA
jgi:hypothetical protein